MQKRLSIKQTEWKTGLHQYNVPSSNAWKRTFSSVSLWEQRVQTLREPSIHPSIHPGLDHGHSSLSRDLDLYLPGHLLLLSWVDTKAFPSQQRYKISPECVGSAPGPSSDWTGLKYPAGHFLRMLLSGKHPKQMDKLLKLDALNVKEQQLYSESLRDV